MRRYLCQLSSYRTFCLIRTVVVRKARTFEAVVRFHDLAPFCARLVHRQNAALVQRKVRFNS